MRARPVFDAAAPLHVLLVIWTVPDRPLVSLAGWRHCDQERRWRRHGLSGALVQIDDQMVLYAEGPLDACQWLAQQIEELLGVRGMHLHQGPLPMRRLRGCHVVDHGSPARLLPEARPAPARGLRRRLQHGPRDDAADLLLVFLSLYRPGEFRG